MPLFAQRFWAALTTRLDRNIERTDIQWMGCVTVPYIKHGILGWIAKWHLAADWGVSVSAVVNFATTMLLVLHIFYVSPFVQYRADW